MSARERIAEALYDDNLRQINANNLARGQHGNIVQDEFSLANEELRRVYLSYADAALKEILHIYDDAFEKCRSTQIAGAKESNEACIVFQTMISMIRESR